MTIGATNFSKNSCTRGQREILLPAAAILDTVVCRKKVRRFVREGDFWKALRSDFREGRRVPEGEKEAAVTHLNCCERKKGKRG